MIKSKEDILQQLGWTVTNGNNQLMFDLIISQAMDVWAAQVLQLNLHSVVQHREPFVKYMVWFRKQNLGQYDHENINEQLADNYIKFLNSG